MSNIRNIDNDFDPLCTFVKESSSRVLSSAWNIVFIDWKYFANNDLVSAERALYEDQNGHGNVELSEYLRICARKNVHMCCCVSGGGSAPRISGETVGPHRVEGRRTAHHRKLGMHALPTYYVCGQINLPVQLGAQVALLISAKFKADTSAEHKAYGTALKRIALFDHYMSGSRPGEKWFVNRDATLGKSPCRYINQNVMPEIMNASQPHLWPVIETYSTSVVPNTRFAGCINNELNKQTVFVRSHLWYYKGVTSAMPKHTVGISMYLHSLKWTDMDRPMTQDQKQEVPSARMSTSDLKAMCSGLITVGGKERPNCQKWYNQVEGQYTTWDYDDKYQVNDWSGAHVGRFGDFDEYDVYDKDDDNADYVMYEEALDNLKHAEKKLKLATALLNRERKHRFY